jgi:hypothetical protein
MRTNNSKKRTKAHFNTLKLLQAVRANVLLQFKRQNYCEGLCVQASELFNEEDSKKFRNYLKKNKPKSLEYQPWYWPIGKVKPRLRWLNAHIKKLGGE